MESFGHNVTRTSILNDFFGDPHKSGSSSIPLSKAVRAGDFVYISGQTANDGKGGIIIGNIEDQTDLIMNNISTILKETGCDINDIIKTTVWISDARDFHKTMIQTILIKKT